MKHQTPRAQAMLRSFCVGVPVRASVMVSILGLLSGCGGRSEPTVVQQATPVSTASSRIAPESIAQAAPSARRKVEPIGSDAAAVSAGQRGVLLTGLPGDNAMEALQFYAVVNQQTTDAKQRPSVSAAPMPLKATLDATATVGQVNAALGAVGARIVAMTPRNRTVTLALTPIGGAGLSNQQVAARLLASRAFTRVQGRGLPALPEELTIDPDAAEILRHDGPSS